MNDLHPDDRPKVVAGVLLGAPLVAWLLAATWVSRHAPGAPPRQLELVLGTLSGSEPGLLAAMLLGLVLGVLGLVLWHRLGGTEAGGAPFRRLFRGTRVVGKGTLIRATRESGIPQVTVAGVPMPTVVEPLHLLVAGSTGAGKSVVMRELAFSALLRGDRVVVADPDGDMVSKFWRPGDRILNPYDARTEGWSIFNEIRRDYDCIRYALSLIPRGQTKDEEEWCAYARVLVTETLRKLILLGNPSVRELHRWTTLTKPSELAAFLSGTPAESLAAVGADQALASARFVLGSKLPPHLLMPEGDFSLRSWLEDPAGGNLFITWRADMAEAMKPLISAWVDALCTSLLSLEKERERRLWLFVDELAGLEKLASLVDGATQGRKAGLRLVAGIQSTAQLDRIYGREDAQTLRSCFRSLVVLGGSCTDPRTSEELSKALGDREVERSSYSRTSHERGKSSGAQTQRQREPVVLPSDIARLPELTGYLAFAGDHPVARVRAKYVQFKNRVPAFEERKC